MQLFKKIILTASLFVGSMSFIMTTANADNSTLTQLSQAEQELARTIIVEAVEEAGRYALTEMRPTANFNYATLDRLREASTKEGGDIKARVSTIWMTAFTGKRRHTVIDLWLTTEGDSIYLTRYKLYSDDHNIPIANPQDTRTNVLLNSIGNLSQSTDDF